eukprot:Gb_05332 [translate_table: standard]
MPDMAPPEGGLEGINHAQEPEANKSEFCWGVKRGVGLKGKEIQFYDSFIYEGVEYSRYDCVYLNKEGEPEPYIGKIIKIWEDSKEKKNKMKVMWFFRPIEIRNWLEVDTSPSNKEIFVASGEGKGVFNINILDVIVGKCKILCTSPDKRNPQPSEEDLANADFFFHRTFDVGKYTVSENLSNIEAEFVFNKQVWVSKSGPSVDRQVNEAKKIQADKKTSNGSHSLEAKEQVRALESAVVDLKRNKVENTGILSKLTVQEDAIPETMEQESEKNEVENSKMPSKLTIKEDGVKEPARTEIEISEIKTNKQESSRDEKKSRPKSRDNSDGVLVTQKEEPKMDEEEDSETPSKLTVKEDGSKEKKFNRQESSREEKKSLKRPKLRVDSDEDEDGLEDLREKKMDSNKEASGTEKKSVKKIKLNDSAAKVSEGLTRPVSEPRNLDKGKKLGRQIIEITKKPEVESNKWFKGLPWDERLRKGYEQRAVIQLYNFDPSYTSAELEDIMWNIFAERCTAKVIPRTSTSNPKCGEALVIFKTKEAAEVAVKKLDEACLMLPSGRPLIATKAGPVASGKFSKFAGHICVEKHKLHLHRAHQTEDMRKAVSTSHCSQPNTIEYEMAMEWRLLQEKSDRWWKELYKQEGEELNKVKHKHLILTSK